MSTLNFGSVSINGATGVITGAIRAEGIIPVGSVIYFANSTVPTGYLKCNGASLTTSVYPDLFTAIGYTYGGSGASFSVPELRGEFIRSFDDGRGAYDSGRSIGSFQDQDWKSLWVTEVGFGWNGGYTHGPSNSGKGIYGINGWSGAQFTGMWNNPSAAQGYLWGSDEVRPRNRALLACIKY